MTRHMTEPIVTCPKCKTEIKLTESLAGPLLESTRQDYEARLAQKDTAIATRENELRQKEEAVTKARESIEDQIAEKLKAERAKISADEAKKARLALSTDLEQKAKELADLQDVLKARDEKLAEAQKAQSDLLKKQRELDDAKRELDLTVERRIQEGVTASREQLRKEADEQLKLKVAEKDQAITSMQKQIEDFASRQKAIAEKEESLAKAKEAFDQEMIEKLKSERARIAADESKKARLALSTDLDQKAKEIADLQDVLKARDEKLAEAQRTQAELIKQKRELDDAKRELDLTVEKRIQEELTVTRQQARKEAEDELKLKVAEKEQTISSMQKQIEDLKRRAEQGSQQIQGEVQELELEALLRAKFPRDTIDPVPKGEFGGDAMQRVVGPLGLVCGTILWESKRTKNWSDSWLAKLRDDQRMAKAEIAVLISQVLPKGIENFDLVDGVWVAHPRVAIPVGTMLRQSLVELATARQASEGQQTKMEILYSYLTGPRFRQRIQAIVEAFSNMKEDLDKERKVITKQWAKRDEQIERVMQPTVGMYGDMQGIAGKTLQEIDGLEIKTLESGEAGA